LPVRRLLLAAVGRLLLAGLRAPIRLRRATWRLTVGWRLPTWWLPWDPTWLPCLTWEATRLGEATLPCRRRRCAMPSGGAPRRAWEGWS